MPDKATSDPFVVIEATGKTGGVPWVRYRRTDPATGITDKWVVRGTCNQCGLCVLGAANPENYTWSGPAGTPMAVTDVRVREGRPDEPVAPGFVEDMLKMVLETPTATVAGCAFTISPV